MACTADIFSKPIDYVNSRFKRPGTIGYFDFVLLSLNKYSSQRLKDCTDLKVLDYGCGATMIHTISLTPKASEIVLAEYTEPNRAFIQKWLDKDPLAHDWTPYFKHVVQTLEGGSDEEVKQREEELRHKVKAVVPCDLTKEQFIAEGYEGPYDVVISILCLENVGTTLEDFERSIQRLSTLLSSGGNLILYTSVRGKNVKYSEGFFIISGERFFNIAMSIDFITNTLRGAGFCNVENIPYKINGPVEVGAPEAYEYITATKK